MLQKTLYFTLACLLMASGNLKAQEKQESTTEGPAATQEAQGSDELSMVEKASRVMAYSYFSSMKKQGIDIDLEQFIEGGRIALADEEIGMSQEEMRSVMQSFQQLMKEKSLEKRKSDAEANLEAGEAFLAENKDKEGVVTLESGVQYKVIQDGEGDTPAITDNVSVRYTGRLLDGEVFDSTADGPPAQFPVGGLIKGMTEMLQNMKVGQKVEVYIPAGLAYGEQGPIDPRTGRPRMDSPIGPNALLIFEMELLDILN